ncbi:MAG: ATP-binding protein [Sphaerochaetaceae bacterium]|nr:ATP-binding protein [Sphaerochaetaceae bacterium]
MIQRNEYLNRIRTALNRSKIAALLGPRQCGKTTLAREIAALTESHVLDMESPVDRSKLQNPEMYLGSLEGLIILDEIQLYPELFPVLRVLADRKGRNGSFLILGSASPQLVEHASQSLAGRVEFIDMQGFDLTETGSDTLEELWLRGGFPLSYLADTEEDSFAWREGFVRTFLQRDIPQLGIRIPWMTLRRFWVMLAHSHGQVINKSQLAGSMGVSGTTIQSYLDILTQTYMIRPLPPWYVKMKKRQVKSPKIYFSDTGLMHHLLGIHTREELLSHPVAGASWEGFAIEQIISALPLRTPYFWSTYSGAEIDLLIMENGRRIGIECKLSEAPKPTKSMYVALEDLSLDSIYVIYPGRERYPLHERIEVISLPLFIGECLNRG